MERLTRAFIVKQDVQTLTASRLRSLYFPLFTELFFELLFDERPSEVRVGSRAQDSIGPPRASVPLTPAALHQDVLAMAATSGLDIITALKFLKLRNLRQRATLTDYLVRCCGRLSVVVPLNGVPGVGAWMARPSRPHVLPTNSRARSSGSRRATWTTLLWARACPRAKRRSICRVMTV